MKYFKYCTHFRTEMKSSKWGGKCNLTKKRVGNCGETKESKKYGCVYTCCHADDLPRYQCVICLRNNYNFDIPAVANALSKNIEKLDRKNLYANHVINDWKTGHTATVSKFVVILICLGQISLMDKMIKTQYTEVELIMKVIWHAISLHSIWPRVQHWQITACVHVAIKLIYQDHNVSSSKNQSTTLVMLLCKKHYVTNSQFIHQRNTFAKNVTNIY